MDYLEYLKEQLSPRDFEIVKSLNLNLDSKDLAEMWPDYVDFEKRWKTEIPFLLKFLKKYKKPKVFDAAAGAGVTSIGLKLAGIKDVISNEIDENFRKVALEQAKKYGVTLTFTTYDWREIPDELANTFDAVFCLGNSLTYLFKKEDQEKAIKNFYKILKPGGVCIVDERNYCKILRGNYSIHPSVLYQGEKVSVYPTYVSESMVILEFTHKITGKKAHSVVYPLK